MFQRIANLSKSNSFFLLGGRATGKSTLIRERYANQLTTFNLLEDEVLRRYQRSADRLRVDETEVRRFARNSAPLRATGTYFVSQDPVASRIEGVDCLHWTEFLARVF